MDDFNELKRFVFNAFLLEDNLKGLEQIGISVRGNADNFKINSLEESDFSPTIVYDAKRMASIFTAFFCLENAVRELIKQRLLERKGIDWWESIPDSIKKSVEGLKQKELKNKYHAQRSDSMIGYTTFGNLCQIIIANWEDFSDLFPNQHWITSRFNDLEMSRNIIMHTGLLPEIEIDRIKSIARDWLRI